MSLWQPQGVILEPGMINAPWYRSHVQVPVVDTDLPDRWRIYFSGRDEGGKSHILFADTAKGDPSQVLSIQREPMLPHGKPGAFDDSGTMPTCVARAGGKKLLYYIGWTPKVTVPYQNAIGAAEILGDSLNKLFEGPVLGMDRTDPFFTGTFFCLADGEGLKGYYLSANGWEGSPESGKLEPVYDIKTATSSDGLTWKKTGRAAVALRPDEGGLASAAVIRLNGLYAMWYSRRGKYSYREAGSTDSYELGFALSRDGDTWTRLDGHAGMPAGRGAWESDMRAYPYVVESAGTFFLFYNGNGFGRSGLGFATCSAAAMEAHLHQAEKLL